MEKLAKELLDIHKEHWKKIDKVEYTGITLPENLKVDLLDIVLDLLNVPKDTSIEEESGTDAYYCRDHFWDYYQGMTTDDFIDYAKECAIEYNMEINQGENNEEYNDTNDRLCNVEKT